MLNPNLQIAQPLTGSTVAANSIAWVNLGGSEMVYVNNTNTARATANTGLMEITLASVSTLSTLSASNFIA